MTDSFPATAVERHPNAVQATDPMPYGKGPSALAENGTVLICFEPECDWWSDSPFPLCMDELLTHDCGGNDGA